MYVICIICRKFGNRALNFQINPLNQFDFPSWLGDICTLPNTCLTDLLNKQTN